MAFALLAVMLAPAAVPPSADAHWVRPATLRAGSIGSDDYPKEALPVRAEGTSVVSYVVGIDGRVSDCAVAESSGNGALDAATCALVQRRFRFRPAADAAGAPISERRTQRVHWRVPGAAPSAPGKKPASG